MGATETIGQASTWRAEVDQLFGLRWDTLVEWVIRAWLALWLWTTWISANEARFPDRGPIGWLIDQFRALSVSPPTWLESIPAWLTSPDRPATVAVLSAASAGFATLASKNARRAGLRVFALAAILLALESSGDAWPLVLASLLALAPMFIALVIAFVQQGSESEIGDSFYSPGIVVETFLISVLGQYVLPIIAPLLVIFQLVAAYRVDLELDPRAEIARTVGRSLGSTPTRLADVDALDFAAVLAASIASSGDLMAARSVPARLLYQLEHRPRRRS